MIPIYFTSRLLLNSPAKIQSFPQPSNPQSCRSRKRSLHRFYTICGGLRRMVGHSPCPRFAASLPLSTLIIKNIQQQPHAYTLKQIHLNNQMRSITIRHLLSVLQTSYNNSRMSVELFCIMANCLNRKITIFDNFIFF